MVGVRLERLIMHPAHVTRCVRQKFPDRYQNETDEPLKSTMQNSNSLYLLFKTRHILRIFNCSNIVIRFFLSKHDLVSTQI
jgi:hypothetical protein